MPITNDFAENVQAETVVDASGELKGQLAQEKKRVSYEAMPKFAGEGLPKRFRGTEIFAARTMSMAPMQKAEPPTAAKIVPEALEEFPDSKVHDELCPLLVKAMVRAEFAEAWMAWARQKIAALKEVDNAVEKAQADASRRAYHICMADHATDSVLAPHTMQPLVLVKAGKTMPNPRHPHSQGRELVMWLRATGGLQDPTSDWYKANTNTESPLFLGHPFNQYHYEGYFAGIADEFVGVPHPVLLQPPRPFPRTGQ